MREQLVGQLDELGDPDAAVDNLGRFAAAHSDPSLFFSLAEDGEDAFAALLRFFSTSQTLTNRLIADPSIYPQIREGERLPKSRGEMIESLVNQLSSVDRSAKAAHAIRRFYSREVIRIAYAEFVRGLSPEKVGRQLSDVSDAVVEASLQFVLHRLAERRGWPQRPDGTTPEIACIALGNLGGEEMSYSSPLKLVFIFDAIDHQNTWHRDFYNTVVADFVSLLGRNELRTQGIELDLREGPRYEVGILICSLREAIRIYETAGRVWQRLSFVKARAVAGSLELGQAMIDRLRPWVYRRFMSRVELAEIRTLRHKLEKRAEQCEDASADVSRAPGGRDDLELTIQFLQLLHGGNLPSVRCRNTYEAILSLERAGCVTQQESSLLSEHYARLCRLQHQLSVTFDRKASVLPPDEESRQRLAWQLGIRSTDRKNGDTDRFQRLLDETFATNRKMINHLMLDAPGDDGAVAIETELLLDPDPDIAVFEATMSGHRLSNPRRAIDNLASLSTETVPFLSPHRCRHFFSAIAPSLLRQVAKTPDPDAALSTLVRVTDSLGAKATLWELLGSSQPTMELMVRLCATTPYLSGILINNPGMIDELIDSLLMNRLPSAQRLDAHSIELCRGAADIEKILHSFKNSAHLNIGVRDMLGKESLEATHQAIGDTAEACLRRMIEHESNALSEQYGDPVDQDGNPSELVTLALGKLGGREPNYHSDLDAVFLYTADGQTQRRVGGHRATLPNQLFFNQLTQKVVQRMTHPGQSGQLYELDSRMRATEESEWAITIDDFLNRFHQGTAPLWQRLALCKARSISGSRELRKRIDAAIAHVLAETPWQPTVASEIREIRQRMQQTARQQNLKRGEGGTVDVEFVAQMLTLKHARQSREVIQPGTTACLTALANAGHLDEKDALALANGYRVLRRIEASLRLMDTPARHELPDDDDSMVKLAFLMNESDPDMIVAQCEQTRQSNRVIFERVFDAARSR